MQRLAAFVAACAAVASLGCLAGPNDRVSGSAFLIGGVPGDQGYLKITSFSCVGTPTCTGVYTGVSQDGSCSNSLTINDGFTITGLDLSHPGTVSGTISVQHDWNSNAHGTSTCTYTILSNPFTFPYTATWDGSKGSVQFDFVDGDHITGNGAFTASLSAPPPVFPMTVSANINAVTSTVTAQIQPRAQDVGTTASVFVFVHAPLSRLAGGKALKDGPDPCVLAQVGADGQLNGVTASTMQAATTGVLTSQGQSVAVLNNVATANVRGVQTYTGYGANASSMLANGVYQPVIAIPGTTSCNANLASAPAPSSPGALTGLFWNANESGWGIHVTQRGTNLFAAWYTYDGAGKPKWYVSTCTGITGTSGTCSGTLYEVTGPNFFGGAFNPNLVNATSAGGLQVTFGNADAASMTYTGVAGQTRTVALTRQPLAAGTASPAVDFSDIWWGGNGESGWGMAMAQQYGTNFLAWYVYDSSGKPTWLVATCTMSGTSCNGTLYRTTGPNFGPAFNPNAVQAAQAGTISVNFTDSNNATLSYTVDGVTATKSVTRQLF